MDTRKVIVVLVLVLGGCAGTFDPTPIPGYAASVSRAGPLDAEDRAEAVMDVTASACLERAELCEEDEDDVLGGMAWQYPDVQVSYPEWRFPTSDDQEVRSVGVTVGVSLSEQRAELDRGNTLTYRGDRDP